MTDAELNTLWLHDRVGRFRDGDRIAGDDLLRAIAGRLEHLARRMLRGFPRVRAGADTGDVVQRAMLRLVSALRDVRPASTREFAGLWVDGQSLVERRPDSTREIAVLMGGSPERFTTPTNAAYCIAT